MQLTFPNKESTSHKTKVVSWPYIPSFCKHTFAKRKLKLKAILYATNTSHRMLAHFT